MTQAGLWIGGLQKSKESKTATLILYERGWRLEQRIPDVTVWEKKRLKALETEHGNTQADITGVRTVNYQGLRLDGNLRSESDDMLKDVARYLKEPSQGLSRSEAI